MKQSSISVEEAVDRNGGPEKARRRALLAGLGKGSAALAAMGPIASHAGNSTHKCANQGLPGGWGCATFSGYQSAIASTTGAVPGKACHPSHYCKTNNAPNSYNTFCGNTSGTRPSASALASKINSYFGCGGTVTRTMVNNTLYASVPKSLVVTGYNLIIYPISSTGGIALQSQNLPSGFTNSLVAFNTIFTSSGDARTLLEVLYDAIQSGSPAHARSYFASAYLTVFGSLPTGATLPVGFDTNYVKTSYPGDSGVGSASDPYNFLKTLCITT